LSVSSALVGAQPVSTELSVGNLHRAPQLKLIDTARQGPLLPAYAAFVICRRPSWFQR
jgi:hypothetical protein